MPPRTVGLIANTGKPGAAALVPALLGALHQRQIEVLVDPGTSPLAPGVEIVAREELGRRCELVVILGGDGTILESLRGLGEIAPPVFGINLGSLGFLTTVAAGDWEQAVECIATGRYRRDERTLLKIELLRGDGVALSRNALNDAVISRGELSRLIKLVVKIDGASLTEYNADGLIISTPTGSTAYSLSAGGPVLAPDSGVFVIAPICPHVLTMRPVIVSDHSVIEITPIHDTPGIFLTVDGQKVKPVERGDLIRITKAPQRLMLATLPDVSFFEVLRQKLKWGGSAV